MAGLNAAGVNVLDLEIASMPVTRYLVRSPRATGGLSILATTLWDRVTRQKDPCAAALAESDRQNATKKRWW